MPETVCVSSREGQDRTEDERSVRQDHGVVLAERVCRISADSRSVARTDDFHVVPSVLVGRIDQRLGLGPQRIARLSQDELRVELRV